MLDIGTKVRIKSWEEIQKTLDKDHRCNRVCFNPAMKDFCGITSKILERGPISSYRLKDTREFYWIPQWFDVVTESDCLNDGSIEQRSLCLALIRQVMSGNEPNLNIFTPNEPCNAKDAGGFYYADFPEDSWFRTIAKNIPDWPCLNLKPEILEEAIKNCLLQCGLQHFKAYIKHNINSWFVFSSTEKCGFWRKVAKTLDTTHLGPVKDTNIEQPYKTKENEIKFQRRKSTILRGVVSEGSQQSSGKCKATTCSGYLSYQVCSGR